MHPRRLSRRIWLLVIAVPLLGLLLSGCVPSGQGATAITVEQGIIYAASPKGKVLALDPQQRSRGLAFPGDREWVFPRGEDREELGIIYARPLLSGDKVFVASFEGMVLVLDRAGGRPIDSEPLLPKARRSQNRSLVATPVLGDNVLLIATRDELNAIDASTGARRWVRPFQAGSRIWASPVLLGNKVIVGSLDRNLYALNLASGEKMWSFETGGGIASTPLVVNSTIYFGSFDGHLYAVSGDGRPVWATPFPTGDWVWSRPLYQEGTLYFGALNGVVYAVDAANGEKRWSQETDAPIRATPALEDGVLVFANVAGEVFGLAPGSGSLQWQRPLDQEVSANLYGNDGEVYIATEEGKVVALEARTGRLAWSYNLAEAGE